MMAKNKKRRLDLPLLLPIGLLLLEIIVFVVLILTGFEITQYLLYFFIILGVYLIYQIARQVITRWRVAKAVRKAEEAQKLADSDQPLEAISIWKKSLLQLPRDNYLETLDRMKTVYESLEMTPAVQQVEAILAKSREFFEMPRNYRQMSREDRDNWRNKALELRKMIDKLPIKKGQDLSEIS
jgi:hypothetical protein